MQNSPSNPVAKWTLALAGHPVMHVAGLVIILIHVITLLPHGAQPLSIRLEDRQGRPLSQVVLRGEDEPLAYRPNYDGWIKGLPAAHARQWFSIHDDVENRRIGRVQLVPNDSGVCTIVVGPSTSESAAQ